jgi:lanosterol synthase
MARTRSEKANGASSKVQAGRVEKGKTDYTRWRLLDEAGRQTWHYLATDEEVKKWPQSIADKYHLGMPTVCFALCAESSANRDQELPELSPAKKPSESINNALEFFSELQLPPGNWGCEYGGPLFLIPGFVITWYVTETPISEPYKIEMSNYLFARQQEDGGWGLHIEAPGTVFGTVMNYTALRLLGIDAEEPRMVKARALIHSLGGAVNGPHWAKFWLSILGVCKWDIVNPTPPELWLLPDWVPIAPWRWWIHMRQVFLPMSFIWSKKWSYPPTKLTLELRKEIFVEEWEKINFSSHRNSISPTDNFYPKTWILNQLNWVLVNVWNPILRTNGVKNAGEAWAWQLIQWEDQNTDYANLGPVNGPMNMLACYIEEGTGSYSVRRHRERLEDFLWVKAEGMLVNGTNGVQNWDTAFAIQAVVDAGLAEDPKWKPMLLKALEYLETQQTLEDRIEQDKCYRHPTKGAWGFSNKDQGYTVSDCTAEAVKAVLLLQAVPGYPKLVSEERIKLAIDIVLTFQNASGGCASYEKVRGSQLLEYLNAAEVFGNIMVEYDYPECTTACVTALRIFQQFYPDYRKADIEKFLDGAVKYIRDAQRADGSWYGSWGICFTYAGMFAIESLRLVGENYENSERVRRACGFFLDKQKEDGGWGESYLSCETGEWVDHPEKTQVVQTAWVCIALMEAAYPDKEPIQKGLKMIMERQQANGEWLQEAIEGVFNKSW